jgi:uncharacterized protein YdaT
MAKRNQHVVPVGNGWAVKGQGAERISVITSSQREAIDYARQIARDAHAEIIVHGRDGKIRDRTSYAKDTHAPKG